MSDKDLPAVEGHPDAVSPGEAPPVLGPGGSRQMSRRQVFITLGGVMLAMFLSSLDQTIVGTALPQIIADLKGFEHYTWVATAYLLTSTAMMPIVGRLTDMYGRKWFYIVGIVIFLVGSALCGLSQSMTQLILFRGLQGIGAGVMMANAFIVIGDLFPPSERGKYLGIDHGRFRPLLDHWPAHRRIHNGSHFLALDLLRQPPPGHPGDYGLHPVLPRCSTRASSDTRSTIRAWRRWCSPWSHSCWGFPGSGSMTGVLRMSSDRWPRRR